MTRSRVSIKADRSVARLDIFGVTWIPFLLGTLMFSAIFLPYFVTLYRGKMTPYLPFISQAAGSPPQSGIFCIFLSLSATVGFFGMHVLYLGIKVYEKRISAERQPIVRFLSKLSLIPGYLSLLGMIVVGGYPIDFHRHENEWISVTVLPHFVGSVALFAGGVAYCCVVTAIMAIVLPGKKKLLILRIILLLCTITAALLHVSKAQDAFALEYNDVNRLRFCTVMPIEYDQNYIVCSLCEWLMVVTFVCFFVTIYDEAKSFSCAVVVTCLDGEPTAKGKKTQSTSQASEQHTNKIKNGKSESTRKRK